MTGLHGETGTGSGADCNAARRYRSTVQMGRWFFGFTLGRLSFFAAVKSDSTWRNYARLLEWVGRDK